MKSNADVSKEFKRTARPKGRTTEVEGQLERPREEVPVQEEASGRLAEVERRGEKG